MIELRCPQVTMILAYILVSICGLLGTAVSLNYTHREQSRQELQMLNYNYLYMLDKSQWR